MFKNVILFSKSSEIAACCRSCLSFAVTIHVVTGISEFPKIINIIHPDCILSDLYFAPYLSALNTEFLYVNLSVPIFYLASSCSVVGNTVLHSDDIETRVFCIPNDMDMLRERLCAGTNEKQHSKKILSSETNVSPELAVSRKISEQFCGSSHAITEVRECIALASQKYVPVLLLGESGTGKSCAARMIHDLSVRKKHTFYDVNVASITPGLADSTLFGTVPGAYTDSTMRSGCFSAAEGGTLFFDEIGELESCVQAKLLQVIEEGVYRSVGSDKSLRTDVRLIFATNADLKAKIKMKQFREDLFYRINKLVITMPPLREHLEDVPVICASILKQYGKNIAPSAVRLIQTAPWPGNVRQLKNSLERAVLFTEGDTIEPESILFD